MEDSANPNRTLILGQVLRINGSNVWAEEKG